MEVVANKHSKRYPIEINYQERENKVVSYVFSLEDAEKLLADLDAAIKEIEGENPVDEGERMLSRIIKHFDWYDNDNGFNAEECKKAQEYLKTLHLKLYKNKEKKEE